MNKTKTIRLPAALTIALAQYYLNRFRAKPRVISETHQAGQVIRTETAPGIPWNKNADLDRITASLPKGWSYQACAGTFWIFRAGAKKTHYHTNEDLWPLAEILPNSKP